MKGQQRTATLAEGWHFRALIVDLTVERHEQLNSLQFPIFCGKRGPLMYILVSKIFNGVAEDFQSVACLGSDVAEAI